MQEIERLCKWAEKCNAKVMVTFSIVGEEDVIHINPKDLTRTVQTQDDIIFEFGQGIRSSKDLFQFDNEDIKVMTDRTKEEMR